jgi:hypothetical protein
METVLAESLVQKGIIHPNLEVEACYKTKGLGPTNGVVQGVFVVQSIERNDEGKLLFNLSGVNDTKRIRVSAAAIKALDGMHPERFARVFNIGADGTIKKKGKKRGRKTKFERMMIGLRQGGYKVDPSFVWDQQVKDVVLWEILPESANDDPSSIPAVEDILETFGSWNIPVVELTEQEITSGADDAPDNFWAWDDQDG